MSVSGGDARINSDWNQYELGCAAIGTSTANSKCGNIEIKESIVTAKGGNGAAAIGLGYTGGDPWSPDTWHNRVESITISNSTVKATVKGTLWDEGGACIGLCTATGAAKLECGTITIKDVNETEFLNNLKREGNFDSIKSWKIGKGMIISNNKGTVIFSGGTFNDKSFADGYGDW